MGCKFWSFLRICTFPYKYYSYERPSTIESRAYFTIGATLNSIIKALTILLSFTPDNRPQRSVEISQRLEMNKATVNRILVTLKNKGFVVQDRY